MHIFDKLSVWPFPILRARGLIALALGVFIPLLGMAVSIPWQTLTAALILFIAILIIVLVLDYLRVRRALNLVEISLSTPSRVNSGIPNKIEINADCSSLKKPINIALRVPAPENTKIEQDTVEFDLQEDLSTDELSFLPLSRGEIFFREISVRARSTLSLCSWQFTVTPKEELKVEVFPDDGTGGEQSLQAFRKQEQGELFLDRVRGEGREFDSLRQYTVGDDLRKIDWKRSAKSKNLLVKVYRPETHQRIQIAIDCGRRMSTKIFDRLQIEYAADAAAHVARLASKTDDEVGLFAFSHRVQKNIKCRRGSAQERLIRNALIDLEIDQLEPDYQLLNQWATMSRRRSLLLLITSISNPSGLQTIARTLRSVRNRHLPMVFAIADQDLQKLTREPAKNLTEAYTIAAAAEQLQRIKRGTEQLSQAGIECMYCQAHELAATAQRKYQEMKLSGRL